MRVLVTGGSGNIGLEVVHCLRQRGDSPVIFDLAPPPAGVGCPAHTGDINDQEKLTSIMREHGVEGVVHLASMLQFGCERDPKGAVEVNVRGTLGLLEACVEAKVKRLSFASSIAAYGSTVDTLDEDSPIQPDVGIYGLSKLLCERVLRRYRLAHGLAARTVRFSTVLSSRPVTSPGIAAAVAKIVSVADGKDAVVEEVGADDLRHYIYFRDAARAAVLTLHAPDESPDLYNVAGGEGSYVTFSGLVRMIKALCPGAGEVRFGKTSGHRGRVNMARATRALGYLPAYSMEKALRELINDAK